MASLRTHNNRRRARQRPYCTIYTFAPDTEAMRKHFARIRWEAQRHEPLFQAYYQTDSEQEE